MNEAQFKTLLERYIHDGLSPDELPEFIHYLRHYDNTGQLEQAVEQALQDQTLQGLSDESVSERIFQKILQQAKTTANTITAQQETHMPDSRKGMRILRWMVAASVLVSISGIIYLSSTKRQTSPPVTIHKKNTSTFATDADPGTDKAILRLADGRELMLDSASEGLLTQQADVRVLKTGSGQLSYNAAPGAPSAVVYNTLSTPRGGQYQLVLPDGSKVWLNAASSLRFPVAFPPNDRVVELTGEAYFEIAPSKTSTGERRTFVVRGSAQNESITGWQVEVLGTHFNIMAYENEKAIHTSLLEGSVKLSTAGSEKKQAVKIYPGQQAILQRDNAEMKVYHANVESAIAWKNGLFRFSSDDIQHIMRQLERWYDVNAIYAGKIPDGHYSGVVNRDSKLSTVLKILEESGLHFKIQDKTLTILP